MNVSFEEVERRVYTEAMESSFEEEEIDVKNRLEELDAEIDPKPLLEAVRG